MPRRKPHYMLCPACDALTLPSRGEDGREACKACGYDLRHRKRKRRGGKAGREVVVRGDGP